jgi:hypothetical protein
LHFSQTLPSFLAFTQHLCSHSLPAALAFSQQVSALATAKLPRRATAHRIALIDFMYFAFLGRPTSSVERLSIVIPVTTQANQATQPYPQSGVITGGL